jgi:hypothetical protein
LIAAVDILSQVTKSLVEPLPVSKKVTGFKPFFFFFFFDFFFFSQLAFSHCTLRNKAKPQVLQIL